MQLKTYLIYCLILYLVLVIHTLLYIEKEKTRRAEKGDRRNRKRENQGEGCRRPLRPCLASLLFRLMPPPSTPSPAAHRVAPPTKEREERAPCPAMGGCHHHHLATTSPPIDQQPDGQRCWLSVILPPLSTLPGCLGILADTS